ncbi:hypothetical protein niasHS_014544 [Heterodera schachtii]|uniref:Fringe-like glycosyltransferase domain-containing protein n=1 Tax=Heterodera schachtii TaxID=97005 RepID=A0ABD2II23_HETSC
MPFPSSSSFGIFFQQQFVFFFPLFWLLFSFPLASPIPISSHSSASDPSILITVKTTRANHRSRVEDALATWASMAGRKGTEKTQILFVSDANSPSPLIQSTKCPPGHTNAALCCKMAAEIRIALQRSPDFWCHFDDDSFVLLANLRAFLRQFRPHLDDLYLGRPSTSAPVVLPQLDDRPQLFAHFRHRKRPFWFGTGGAGICLSALTLRRLRRFIVMGETHQPRGNFQWVCAQLGVPDDVALGFILENFLAIPLTRTDRFHSHLNRMDEIPRSQLSDQISLSGSEKDANFVNVPEKFDGKRSDLLHFRSLFKFILLREGQKRREKEATKEKEDKYLMETKEYFLYR